MVSSLREFVQPATYRSQTYLGHHRERPHRDTVTVRVIEYFGTVESQLVPEMFCLITNLTDTDE